MAYDFSQVSDSELETAVQAILNSSAASFATPAAQKQAMLDELARRRAARQQPPNVQSNLEASATPIPVEPVAGEPSQEDIDDALGFPTRHRAAAAMAVPGGGLGVRNTPEDLAAYGQVVRDAYGRIIDRGVARRQAARQQGYQDPEQVAYNSATGVTPPAAPMESTVMVDGVEVPVHSYDASGRPRTTIGADRRAREAQDAAFTQAGGRFGVPGPVNDATGRSGPAREFSSPEEAARYYTRPTDPATGQLMPSQADTDMLARGFVAVYSPEGRIVYQLAANTPQNDGMSPAARRQAGFYAGQNADGTVNAQPNFEVREVNGPFGPVSVLAPTEATRSRMNERRQMAAAERVAARTGRPVEELLDPAKRGAASRQHYLAGVEGRRRLVANRAMLAGGSSGLRGGLGGNMGMFSALAMLQGVDPAQMDAQQQALVEMLPINEDRAKIEAARNAQLTELGLRTAQGRGFQQPDPAVADAQAQRRRDAALAQFNSWYDRNVGFRAGPYTWDRFESQVTFLMSQFGLSRAEAEAIAQSRGMPRGARGGAAPGADPAPGFFPTENDPGGLGTPM